MPYGGRYQQIIGKAKKVYLVKILPLFCANLLSF